MKFLFWIYMIAFSLLLGCANKQGGECLDNNECDGVYENIIQHNIDQMEYEVVIDVEGTFRGVIPRTEKGKYILYDDDNDYEYSIRQHFMAAYIADRCVAHGYSKEHTESALVHVCQLPDIGRISEEETKDIFSQCFNAVGDEIIYEAEHKVNEKQYGCGDYFRSSVFGGLDVYTYSYNIKVQRITEDIVNKLTIANYELEKEYPTLTNKHVGAILVSYYSGM